MAATHHLPDGITVLERGWLSSNNIVLHAPGEGVCLIDSGHVNHAEQTVQLLRHVLAGRPLARLLNTHLHSDHCGGNAALARAFGVPVLIPPGLAAAVRGWDEDALSYRASGQRCAAFGISGTFEPGAPLQLAGREWQVLAAPGHDPHSIMLFQRESGVLISADALWQDGFGVVFPEVAGEPGFDDVEQVLDTIAALPVKVVIPGHGAPFTDASAALQRARSRLAGFRADPSRHARHASRVLVKYHVMAQRQITQTALLQWAQDTPLMHAVWQRHPPRGVTAFDAWVQGLVQGLVQGGALSLRDGVVHDA